MKERIIPVQKIAELPIDLFLSAEFLVNVVQKQDKENIDDFMNARRICMNTLGYIQKTIPSVYFGIQNIGTDYSTGHFIGSREMELILYNKETAYEKKEFAEIHKDKIDPETLEKILEKAEKIIKTIEPIGTGVHFWANDCYGRCSKIMAAPNGFVKEEIHGRAKILLRDPIELLKNLPQNREEHDFYQALCDKELMHIIKNTDQFDELLVKCKSYEQIVGTLNKALENLS